MTWQSRVPAVLDALVSLWSTTPELEGLVRDGPLPVESADPEVLSVGHDDDDTGASTDGQIAPEGYGVEPNREQFSVTCLISVVDGANDTRAARARAFELLSAASAAITSDITLGGVVMQAGVQQLSLNQLQTVGGAEARILFGVACDAYTRR